MSDNELRDGLDDTGTAMAPLRVPRRLRLTTLGELALVTLPAGEPVAGSQRHKLVLLAYLALTRRPVLRDTLVDMFWGDEPEERGRHSLSNALSYLRRILGPPAIAVRRSEISLAAETPLDIDAAMLLAAASERENARVIELYTGPFMSGVYMAESESFDLWVESERATIGAAVATACDAECLAAARRSDWSRCATVARTSLDLSPTSTEAALHLLNSLRAAHTPEGRRAALEEYRRLVVRLHTEYGTSPHQRVTELADRIAARAEQDHTDVVTDSADQRDDAESPRHPDAGSIAQAAVASVTAHVDGQVRTRERRMRLWPSRMKAAITCVAVLVLVAGAMAVRGFRSAAQRNAATARPLIVVTDVANISGDTASEWLEQGLSQMISADLSRSSHVEVVTPARVRDTRERERLPAGGGLKSDAALDLARRLGATLIVRGGFSHGSDMYVLDVDVRDASDGQAVRSFTVTGAEPMNLADQAAGLILESSVADDARPRFAEIETPNVVAYQHFLRALQADAEGRRADARRELDAAISIDSAFASALGMRAEFAHEEGDVRSLARLASAMHNARFTTRDVLNQAIDSATHNGESSRAQTLAEELVRRYPHDPRSYTTLAQLYEDRGDWDSYEATARRELALDSLADEAGDGPCVPCSAYSAIVEGRTTRGDIAGGEKAARRWVRLQPDLPAAWATLAVPLAYAGRFDAALDADRRATLLSGGDPAYLIRTARDLILARKLRAADSLSRSWSRSEPQMRDGGVDIQTLVMRERGQLRASIRALEAYHAATGSDDLVLEEVDAYGRIGDFASAARLWEARIAHSTDARVAPRSLRGDRARWYTWTHAILANAIAGSGDTVRLRAIADSMRIIGARSYYGRDWKLYSHVLGLIAMRGQRYAEAERDFQTARWGGAGWTETIAWLARAQLSQGHALAAVTTLRAAYQAPLDAMGRYQPRSELDYLMGRSFKQAGMEDSARVYSSYARAAWSGADPELTELLAVR